MKVKPAVKDEVLGQLDKKSRTDVSDCDTFFFPQYRI